MPLVRKVRQTNGASGGNSRRSNGTTKSSNIGRNSRGGPGSITSHFLEHEDGGLRMEMAWIFAILHLPSSIFVNFHGQPRRGAVRIGQHHGAFGHERLDFVVFRHRQVARRETFLMWSSTAVIQPQFFAEQLRNQIAREVVGGRAEAAGGDDQVRAAQRFTDGGLDVVRRVRHGHLAGHDVTEISQAAAKPLLVRVEHAAEHQFAAGVDEFDVHAAPVSGGFRPLASPRSLPHRQIHVRLSVPRGVLALSA